MNTTPPTPGRHKGDNANENVRTAPEPPRIHLQKIDSLHLQFTVAGEGFRRRRPMARPAPDLLAPRIAPASRLTSFGGYRPAVCGHPTGMILTRAHRSSDLLRKRASPGGYFTRALCAGGQNHAGPANVLSCASRLSGLCASLLPSARRGDSLATEKSMPPKYTLRVRDHRSEKSGRNHSRSS